MKQRRTYQLWFDMGLRNSWNSNIFTDDVVLSKSLES